MLSWAIPSFRLPRAVVEADVADVLALGPTLVTGRALGRDFSTESLLADGFDAVFLGIGAGRGRRLGIESEGSDQVIQVLDLLARVSSGERPSLGSRVIVLGGGDSAVDGARTALRLGASDVRILYRRARPDMPASGHEVERAIAEGVVLEDRVAPVRVVARDGRVSALLAAATSPGEPDSSGRARPALVPGSEREIPADTILVAVGQAGDSMGEAGPGCGATAEPWVFAGGDAVLGPSTVVRAIASGRAAARSIHRMLSGIPGLEAPFFEGPESASDASSYVTPDLERVPRLVPPSLAAHDARRSWDEAEMGSPRPESVREAGRCLGCASCARCEACISTFGCPAFFRDARGRIRIDPVLCWGCGVCAALCPDGAIRRVDRRPA